jgi:diaminopimelate epimerase
VHLTKHHGLGNDFLVVLDQGVPSPALTRRLCDRRRGIGADGLITGRSSDDAAVDLTMVLHNADGSRAEMSGNGIRCLAQAVLRRRGAPVGDLRIGTDAGVRCVTVRATEDPAVCEAEVDLGMARAGPTWAAVAPAGLLSALGLDELRADSVDVGNPHLVVLAADPSRVDLARFGPVLEAAFPSGINVEFVAARPGRRDEIDVAVWERGAGITEACGTGASASALVAHRWGLVGEAVTVHLPGGTVDVRLGATITLTGPAAYVADIEVEDLRG